MAFTSLVVAEGGTPLCPILTGRENYEPWLQGMEWQLLGIDDWDHTSPVPNFDADPKRRQIDRKGMSITAKFCGPDPRTTKAGSKTLKEMFDKPKDGASGWTAKEYDWASLQDSGWKTVCIPMSK